MAFKVPTLSEVSKFVENGFSSALYGKSGNLRVGVLKVLSKVVAGAAYLPIMFCGYIFKNSFIDSADAENLVRFGGWYNCPHKPATFAHGIVNVSGTGTIPLGTILEDDNGISYETLDELVCNNANAVSLRVVATEFGSGSNADYQTKLKLRDIVVSGITSIVVGYGGIYGGCAEEVTIDGNAELWGESVEDYRKRLKYRRQHQPMGGCDSDYRQWAESFTYVTNSYVVPNYPKTNSVSIFLANFNSEGCVLKLDELKEVREFVTSPQRKPITADVIVATVSPVELKCNIDVPVLNDATIDAVCDVVGEYLKGFAPGTTISLEGIKSAIISMGIVDKCDVTNLFIGNVKVSSGSYTLGKSYSQSAGVVTSISGEVANVNRLKTNITFGVLT